VLVSTGNSLANPAKKQNPYFKETIPQNAKENYDRTYAKAHGS
jgi:hypothetical protein